MFYFLKSLGVTNMWSHEMTKYKQECFAAEKICTCEMGKCADGSFCCWNLKYWIA